MHKAAGKLFGAGAGVIALLALAGCEEGGSSMSASDQAQVGQLSMQFQSVCGVLARSGSLDATRRAALQAGFQEDGIDADVAGYGFTDFEYLSQGPVQIQLSKTRAGGAPPPKAQFCGIVAQSQQGRVSDALFKASASAMAKTNGTAPSQPPKTWANDVGMLQFVTGNRTVRLGHQSLPAGLVLYTFAGSAAGQK
ncbi:MAG: hypothetical protein QM682_05615 [Paracoccus sp. (in: a-proteobacteria)]|uniref:hypothetical protein n=1 Tax=Paracoccus sp. TaxID=267 RepID=UPI0039E32E0A